MIAEPWWQIDLDCASSEDLAPELCERGAAGAEILSPSRLRIWLRGTSARRDRFLAVARASGGVASAVVELPAQNWTAECQELLEPVQVGEYTVLPLRSSDEAPAPSGPQEIYLVTGTGFGTGHHPSTRMAALLLQSDAIRRRAPRRALDFGTGSGILAVFIARCYAASVDAVDNDPLALENARDNVMLNGCAELIRLDCGDLSRARGKYDLIVANIYAEVLETLVHALRALLSDGGLLVLSGILAEKAERLHQDYVRGGFQLLDRTSEGGWTALCLRAADSASS